MRTLVGIAALSVALSFTSAARAQFQSCTFCDVNPTAPDPMLVLPCSSGTIVISGVGYQDTRVNDCDATPVTGVRSTRPDRVNILAWRVLSDGSIEVDYFVPCTATPGRLGIDVTIDDNPADAVEAYACGNVRMEVDRAPIVLSVQFDYVHATWSPAGVEVVWGTLSEYMTAGFDVVGRLADGTEVILPTTVFAHGPGRPYHVTDPSTAARAGAVAAYRLVERTFDGIAGDASPWVVVDQRPTSGRGTTSRPSR